MKSGIATRDYNSPLREKQAADTREAIVDALVEQVSDESLADFSLPKVAERAGVSVRTIYRHFPNREDLLAAVNDRFSSHRLQNPTRLEDFPGHAIRLFRVFEERPAEVMAALHTSLGKEAHALSRAPRHREMRKMIDELLPNLSEGERRGFFAVSRALISADAWRTMRTSVGPEHMDDAAEFTAWAMELVIKEAKKRDARAARAAQNKPAAKKPASQTKKAKRGKKGTKS